MSSQKFNIYPLFVVLQTHTIVECSLEQSCQPHEITELKQLLRSNYISPQYLSLAIPASIASLCDPVWGITPPLL